MISVKHISNSKATNHRVTVCHQNIRAKVRYMQFVTHCERFKRICVNPSVKFTYAVYPKSLLFEQVKQIDSLSGCSG